MVSEQKSNIVRSEGNKMCQINVAMPAMPSLSSAQNFMLNHGQRCALSRLWRLQQHRVQNNGFILATLRVSKPYVRSIRKLLFGVNELVDADVYALPCRPHLNNESTNRNFANIGTKLGPIFVLIEKTDFSYN